MLRTLRPACVRRQLLVAAALSLAFLAGVLAVPSLARAERLPLRTFTTADGLAHDRVTRIVRDSRGFLWFCTAAGLSRFDGRTFVSYSVEHGLPPNTLNDLLENPDGSYWIATNGAGVVRYDPVGDQGAGSSAQGTPPRFAVVPIAREAAANRVNVLYRDRAGRLLTGTDDGLFVMEGSPQRPLFRRVPLGLASHPDHLLQVWSLLERSDGSLWIGTSAGLVRWTGTGDSIEYSIRPVRGADHVWALTVAPDGRLWIGHDTGLLVASFEQLARPPRGRRIWPVASYLVTGTRVPSLLSSSAGDVWAGTDAGLHRFSADGREKYGAAHGLEGILAPRLAEDAHGNIWLSTAAAGATRIARNGLTTYTRSDGLSHDVIGMLLETHDGRLCAISRGSRINVFDGRRFHEVVPNVPRDGDTRTDSYYAVALHDRSGEWWFPSGDALYRFPAVPEPSVLARIRPKAVYQLGGSPGSRTIWRLFEDSRGDVWIARRFPIPDVLIRLERATGRLHRYTDRDGLPPSAAVAFAEDRSGTVWIGFWDAGLARYRNGRFETFSTADGFPGGGVTAMHVDGANRLWCATAHGALRIDEPGADRPRPVLHSMDDGLADDGIVTITDDQSGRLYLGTRRGVDRLDLESGRITHFTTADGLAALETRAAFRDSTGAVWFSTARGLSRLLPGPDRKEPAPATFIQDVRLDGLSRALPDFGTTVAGPVTAASTRSRIEVGFFALDFHPGETLKYQYKLDGLEEWSLPSEQRTVIYPRLQHGTYRLSVRAIRGDGRTGDPAALSFTIPSPIWARWWFILMAASAIALTVHAAYRYRLARLIEIERIRTRLAMDLHDDIGSTLSQVAVLSEVARNRPATDGRQNELLERIAEISRHLVDAMSDVVWAINPERDSLRDLLQRMRRFASDTLDARDIKLRFSGPPAENLDVRLDAHVRREVFLIFKESITNLLRYARCSSAEIDLQVDGSSLVLRIADDGVGVDPVTHGEGLGLRSMQERAERLHADLRVWSAPLKGTVVNLIVPLEGRPRRRNSGASPARGRSTVT